MNADWLKNARRVESPNFDERPANTIIDMLVIHCISLPPGVYGGHFVEKFFCNKLDYSLHPYFKKIIDLKVSSHLFITRDGELIQFVPFSKRAWHAGESKWRGQTNCNDFSVGIELEGLDCEPFSDIQYETLNLAVNMLKRIFPEITNDRIVGHSDIAPGRKSDPGNQFDWSKLK